MKPLFTILACWVLFSSPSPGAETYDARTAEKQIFTPVPPAAPRINGPVVYGARPGNPFLYRIPTQGERPIRFEVKGLPEGLKLDANNGIITGQTPARTARSYPAGFMAANTKANISGQATPSSDSTPAKPVKWKSVLTMAMTSSLSSRAASPP